MIGNSHIGLFLAKKAAGAKSAPLLSESFIFSGPEDVGKVTAALRFAETLLCETGGGEPCGSCHSCKKFSRGAEKGSSEGADFHSDLHFIGRQEGKKNISIEQIRELIRKLSLSSFLNSYKIGIIKEAENLSEEAANALLKTLEEPRPGVIIILTVSDPDRLPKTILSRAQILQFRPVKADIIYDYLAGRGASRSEAKNFSRLSGGRPALAFKFFEDKEYLEKYLRAARAFLEPEPLETDPIGSIGKGGQEGADAALEVIEIWRKAARDLVLIHLGNGDLVQNEILDKELERAKDGWTPARLLGLMEDLDKASLYIKGNVQPRLVLERIALNL